MDREYYVYKHTNRYNGKVYIGITHDIKNGGVEMDAHIKVTLIFGRRLRNMDGMVLTTKYCVMDCHSIKLVKKKKVSLQNFKRPTGTRDIIIRRVVKTH